jgi:glyoxylase-like metal-dependent hydrolase (beta-lactamase superfamily II)
MTKNKYCIFHPAQFRLDGGAMFGIIPRPMWAKLSPPDDENRIDLALRVFLYDFGEKKILIDGGIGDYHGEKFESRFDIRTKKDPLTKVIETSSYKVEEITDIVITHLHFDHVGGLGTVIDEEFTPVFPNARIHLHKKHWEYAKNPTMRDSGSFQKKYFMPLVEYYIERNQVHWVDVEEGTLIESGEKRLWFKTSHGHTPHQIHPFDQSIIYMADILPTSNHLGIPWVMGYDINPGQSVVDKAELYEFILEKNLALVFEHDPNFWGARIGKNEKGRWIFTEKFSASNEPSLPVDL